ncbi:hypothetical protein C7271_04415 [filamentous cyanobacterium CCP5]|nr:hypothetical protein C7271_04415 [filamentous cyanobacterium CCP5]
MAASSLLELTPLRSPTVDDRQQLIQAAKQHIAAKQRAFLHQQQQLFAKRRSITIPGKSRSSQAATAASRTATAAITRPLVPLKYKTWAMQYSAQAAQTLDSIEAVTDLFQQDGVEGRLLILGEPGTGKSYTLCGLGATLLGKIRPSQPVPILLDVTGWRGEEFRPWIIDQIWLHYRVPRNCATAWLDASQLALLVDGFDALKSNEQRACAKAMDTLMRSNPDQVIALCCQRQAIEQTGITFNYFNSGVQIIPFAAQQVKDYVMGVDSPDTWQGIKGSKSLQHLARFPLMLNMLVESYDRTPAANRGELLQQYVSAQLAKPIGPDFRAQNPDSLRRFLGWLARHLSQRERIFTIDSLDPSWLPGSQQLLYRLLLTLALLLIVGSISSSWLLGLAVGIVAAQVDVDHFFRYRLSLASLSGKAWLVPLLTALLLGTALALPLGVLIGAAVARFTSGVAAGLYSAAAGATLGFWGGLLFQSWGGLQHGIRFKQRLDQDLTAALVNGSLLSLMYGGLLAAMVLLSALFSGQTTESLINLGALRQLVGITIGLVMWASYALQHLILRALLIVSSQGAFPLSLRAYLNEAVERKLLYRVGGSYSFIHEQVREQLAQGS